MNSSASKIYLATGNSGKVKHVQKLLPDFEVEQLEVETVEPQEASLEEIAEFKVRTAGENSDIEEGLIVADDSGLFVNELNGFPGPLSAPFEEKVGKQKLLKLIDDNRDAEFRCCVATLDPGTGEVKTFSGSEKGEIVEPKGDGGFGYDPMFLPEGNDKTWGEDSDYKYRSSHRKEAVEKLKSFLEKSF